ncbi:hypothetical protein A3A93_05245 [Candidatus Roizmanbacteria bacterium RIFCSPLOWO2_01_FULL_38_12]|uniref:Uncharacterized protein n=1 Tax=Candidatus Roizmanbacteria bacterium RIFCSPLOWO2_01_FULL_38_12 TaxID=1802061 RepID=A0A1F7IZ06_9BACT|nr:MAG: hypothetical protein A2861_03460 [Candidatus Roizmanbacteria bacterium RIFCSPHIGHO2_01_FULL_38_15]OGK35635.1 MAG: hypothetical protein A3F59_01675 [Candidatus Roizmanbacteria bacterium RIFCSPHIGHO2_12_FULL_38_13]OGK48602.1 MAG: hypothetical protein A3A93_05245 [Candidatus Roizmanbacteria bacterium RIFCSPLOWO2_01_FULL_38_12]
MGKKEKSSVESNSFAENVFPHTPVVFEPRSFQYIPTYVSPIALPETNARLLGIYNQGNTSGFEPLGQLISPLGISRDIRLHDSQSGKNFSVGGIGLTTVNDGQISVKDPRPDLTVEQYVGMFLDDPHAMTTLIIDEEGNLISKKNATPVGAYTIEGAEKKRQNTQTAERFLSGVALVPQVELICTDATLGLAGFVTSAPSQVFPAELVEQIGLNRLKGKKNHEKTAQTVFTRSLADLSRALCILHIQGFVHNQPSGNWGTVISGSEVSIILRDWATMQDIRNHNKTPMKEVKAFIIPITAQELARLSDVAHLIAGVEKYLLFLQNIPTDEKGRLALKDLFFKLRSQIPWLILRAYKQEKLSDRDLSPKGESPDIFLNTTIYNTLLDGLHLKIKNLPVNKD